MRVRSALLVESFGMAPSICTTVGPNHHQVWGDLLARYHLPAWAELFVQVPYTGIPVVAMLVYLRPRWVAGTMAGMGCTMLVASRILLPVEWESVWCWLGGALVAFAVVEPHAGELFERRRTSGNGSSPVRERRNRTSQSGDADSLPIAARSSRILRRRPCGSVYPPEATRLQPHRNWSYNVW